MLSTCTPWKRINTISDIVTIIIMTTIIMVIITIIILITILIMIIIIFIIAAVLSTCTHSKQTCLRLRQAASARPDKISGKSVS